MVFPGADYSRFSHSLGVCHVTQRILNALKAADVTFSAEEERQYRLAGLLHDVGHYPFSHAMERAVHDHNSRLVTEAADGTGSPTPGLTSGAPLRLDHEWIGKEVIRHDKELRGVLESVGVTPESVYQIFTREVPTKLANLISSDLDADRIDFLMRTAHYTGLPYGSVDLNYLLTQMRLDSEENVCIGPKALRTADHFLLGRYFDYQQVAFNKTVAALEWVIEHVIRALLDEEFIKCGPNDLQSAIADGTWATFDDSYIIEQIRRLAETSSSPITQELARSVLYRQPPKLVASVEYLNERSELVSGIKKDRALILGRVGDWAKEFGIPSELWHVWEGGHSFTKVAARVSIAELAEKVGRAKRGESEEEDADRTQQAIRVLARDGTSKPIMNDRRSLMSVLSDQALFSLRVYVIIPPDKPELRNLIAERIRSDLDMVDWA
jgi:HD superfamily phosphohydrolase